MAKSNARNAVEVIPTNSGKLQPAVISHSYGQWRVLFKKKFKSDAMSKEVFFPGLDNNIARIDSRN